MAMNILCYAQDDKLYEREKKINRIVRKNSRKGQEKHEKIEKK